MTKREEAGRKGWAWQGLGEAMEEGERREGRRGWEQSPDTWWESLGIEKEHVRAWRPQPTSQWVTSSWWVINQLISQHSVAHPSHSLSRKVRFSPD